MRLLLGLALLAATPAFAAQPPGPAEPVRETPIGAAVCDANGNILPVDRTRTPGGARRLIEAPPANMERAVLRRVGPCVAPVIVRYGVDRRPREATPRR